MRTASVETGRASLPPSAEGADAGSRALTASARHALAARAGLVWTLVRTDFKARYHGTLGGFVWALLKPLAMFVVLMSVFSFLFPDPGYKLNLIVGLFLWDFFAEGTKSRPDVASRPGFPADQGALSDLDPGRHLDLECGHHPGDLLPGDRVVPRARRPSSDCRCDGALRRLQRGAHCDRDRLLAGGERAVPALPRSEPGLGRGVAGGVFPRADHLSARHRARAVSSLSLSLAADADHRVLARGAGHGRGADADRARSTWPSTLASACCSGSWSSVGSRRDAARIPRKLCTRSPCRAYMALSRSRRSRRRSGFPASGATPFASTCSARCGRGGSSGCRCSTR